MALANGSRVGPYEIVASVGAGGMGEVYRARDSRLGRDVAIKVLPETLARDHDRLTRFEREARAVAALNHPNILGVFDIGTHDGAPYLVSELLDGQTLRTLLRDGPLPIRKVLQYARQIALGLAAAHESGVIHRDLKPDNIFVTHDGRVKILDFGLAKITMRGAAAGAETEATLEHTSDGAVLGTAGYMSPEQVRGRPLDHRSDLFSFGIVLYEMTSGVRPFRGASSVETMNAILKEDPPDISTINPQVPPGLERVVRHCLEKNPAERFQSAHDLAFDLDALSDPSTITRGPVMAAPTARRKWMAAAVVLMLLAAGAFLLGRQLHHEKPVEFLELTFQRGHVFSSRFAPDGNTVLYSASWEGKPSQVFSTVPDSRESRPVGVDNAELLAVSSRGELAVLLRPRMVESAFARVGTLARASAATAPREIADDVQWADWCKDDTLVVVRDAGERASLEYPVGKQIYVAKDGATWFTHVRCDPATERIAVIEHPDSGDDHGYVLVLDKEGKVLHRSADWGGIYGLAWTPTGKEIWFAAIPNEGVLARQLWATTIDGKVRTLMQAPGELTLQDISKAGEALLTTNDRRRSMIVVKNGVVRDLSWLDRPVLMALSNDGTTVLFHEGGKAGGRTGTTYVRSTDGGPAIKLSPGYALALSPDRKWALVRRLTDRDEWRLVPIGPGETRVLRDIGVEDIRFLQFDRDAKHLLFQGQERGRPARLYSFDIENHKLQPLTPEGTFALAVSPDRNTFLVRRSDNTVELFNRSSGKSTVIKGEDPNKNDVPLRLSDDGQTLYVARPQEGKAEVWRVNLFSGKWDRVSEWSPQDPTGVELVGNVRLTPDGSVIGYGFIRQLSDLYLVRNLR